MRSIQKALIFKLGFWACALALLAGAGFYLYMRSALTASFDQSLAAKARSVATQLKREGDGRLEFEFSKKSMPEFQRQSKAEYFQIALPEGTPIAASKSLNGSQLGALGLELAEPGVGSKRVQPRFGIHSSGQACAS